MESEIEVKAGSNFLRGVSAATKATAQDFLTRKGYMVPRQSSGTALYHAQLSVQNNLPVFIPSYLPGMARIGDYKISSKTYTYDPLPGTAEGRYRFTNYNYQSVKMTLVNIAFKVTGKPIWCEDTRTDFDYCLLVIALLDLKVYEELKTKPVVQRDMISVPGMTGRQKIANNLASVEQRLIRYCMESLCLKTASVEMTRQCQLLSNQIIETCQGYVECNAADAAGGVVALEWVRMAKHMATLKDVMTPKELFVEMFSTKPTAFRFANKDGLTGAYITSPEPLTEQEISSGTLNSLISISKSLVNQKGRTTIETAGFLSSFPRDTYPTLGYTEADDEYLFSPNPKNKKVKTTIPTHGNLLAEADGYPAYKTTLLDLIEKVKTFLHDKKQLPILLCVEMLDSIWSLDLKRKSLTPGPEGRSLGAPEIPSELLSKFLSSNVGTSFIVKKMIKPVELPRKTDYISSRVKTDNIEVPEDLPQFQTTMLTSLNQASRPTSGVQTQESEYTQLIQQLCREACAEKLVYELMDALMDWQRQHSRIVPDYDEFKTMISSLASERFQVLFNQHPLLSPQAKNPTVKRLATAILTEQINLSLFCLNWLLVALNMCVGQILDIFLGFSRVNPNCVNPATSDPIASALISGMGQLRVLQRKITEIDSADKCKKVWPSVIREYGKIADINLTIYGTVGYITLGKEDQLSNKSHASGMDAEAKVGDLDDAVGTEIYDQILLANAGHDLIGSMDSVKRTGILNKTIYVLASSIGRVVTTLKLPQQRGKIFDLLSITSFFILLDLGHCYSKYVAKVIDGNPNEYASQQIVNASMKFDDMFCLLLDFSATKSIFSLEPDTIKFAHGLLSEVGGRPLTSGPYGSINEVIRKLLNVLKGLVEVSSGYPNPKMIDSKKMKITSYNTALADLLTQRGLASLSFLSKPISSEFLKGILQVNHIKETIECPTTPEAQRQGWPPTFEIVSVFKDPFPSSDTLNRWIKVVEALYPKPVE